ncbi:class I SAM-dependent methyltransferase [uncultured Hyphomicrobium sp.]|uniref:class I SAM-dependent methyltransferase n=1 Tax=uncultured Hyphomicrobium sp. TaxID=194373 RepID=UPI0025F2FF98|nr:class I SAM-dependent methyltransferase [uncultured Hyphomicrobium sp.]
MSPHSCRFCQAPLTQRFADLGRTPLANSYLGADQLQRSEPSYPLVVFVCSDCRLVQADAFVPPEDIFGHYAYFSSYSESWVQHAQRFASMARCRFGLTESSQVIEVASNDGYLLRHFVGMGVPALGIEPAENVASVARAAGVPTEARFFGTSTAADLVARGLAADLAVGNNVLAHVPDINDFVGGLAGVLKPDGVVSVEFPHLLRLIEEVQFDTIYHEHFYYLSLLAVEKVFAAHGLKVFDVEELPTHGGSLRVLATRVTSDAHVTGAGPAKVRADEAAAGLGQPGIYDSFQSRIAPIKVGLIAFLMDAKGAGKTVAAYGAAAKGNTLLNFCGIGTDLIDYVVDRNPHKQGQFLPGSKLPIYSPEKLAETRPDFVLILPWNIKNEVMAANSQVRSWGGRFVIAVPKLTVLA